MVAAASRPVYACGLAAVASPCPRRRRVFNVVALATGLALCGWLTRGLASLAPLKPPPQPVPPEDVEPPTTGAADAWTEAARRMADGRADAVAHLEAAWHRTDAWWLRPLAYAFAVGLGLSAGLPRRVAEAGNVARVVTARILMPRAVKPQILGQKPEKRKAYLSRDDCTPAMRALRKLELPFFATSAEWENRPVRGIMLRGRFRQSLQTCLLQEEQHARATLEEHLSRELDRAVQVHVLREEDPAVEGQQQQPTYQLFLQEAPAQDTEGVGATVFSLASLAVTMAVCSQQIGLPNVAQMAGPGSTVLAGDSALPTALLFSLLFLGEAGRAAAAKALGGSFAPPAFLASPQLGVLGTFPGAKEAPYRSRTAALGAAMAGPLTVALASAVLVGYALLQAPAGGLELHASFGIAWPLSWLPRQCSPELWAGAHGLLMAGLSLLPHSPAGQAAWQSLAGRNTAEKMATVAAYLYPLLGLLGGQSWFFLPLWWAFLTINVSVTEVQLPLEEVSEVPTPLRVAAAVTLFVAAVSLLPVPLDRLPQLLTLLQ